MGFRLYTQRELMYPVILLFSKVGLVILIGVVFLVFVGADQRDVIEEQFKDDWHVFTGIFASLEQYAPEGVSTQDIMHGGIRGMLQTLDPHTHFLDQDAFSFMQEEQEGSFYGIGISFDISTDGYLRVVAPIDGTPAQKLGIRAGDRIVKIDNVSTKGITEVEVIRKLRGKEGSSVVVTIERIGVADLKDYKIIRGKIPLFTVREPYMIRPDIGYIKVTQFSKPTTSEVEQALEKLSGLGMKKLVLDLRSNPGGLLDQAVDLADVFLDKGDPIVRTGGRIPSSHFEFKARTHERYSQLPIIVLVNAASASASEIVAGAMQDLDRALIVGSKTYGKGLVQRQYPLPLETALQITTAKYYTPSGRCIQRSYETPHEQVLREKRKQELKTPEKEARFYSRAGREILGSGGITPDVVIDQKIPRIVIQLFAQDLFFEFGIRFRQQYDSINSDFQISDKLLDEFKVFASEKINDIDPDVWNREKETIKLWILQEIISVYSGLEAKLRIANEHDEQLIAALTYFNQAEQLLLNRSVSAAKSMTAE